MLLLTSFFMSSQSQGVLHAANVACIWKNPNTMTPKSGEIWFAEWNYDLSYFVCTQKQK
jgi:hypothetical protein